MEYEDHISIVAFTYGCNFKCSYCYNYDYIMSKDNIISTDILGTIDPYMTPLIDGFVWLGGEPTIYPHLLGKSLEIKDRYGLDIKLFTNGSNPSLVLQGIYMGAIDALSIDFKTIYNHDLVYFNGVGTIDNYLNLIFTLFEGINELKFNENVEVRTTEAKGLANSEMKLIQGLCEQYGLRHIVQKDVRASYKKLGIL